MDSQSWNGCRRCGGAFALDLGAAAAVGAAAAIAVEMNASRRNFGNAIIEPANQSELS